MAGPTVGILSPYILNRDYKEKILSYINSISSSIEKDSFWVKERPFIFTIGSEYPEELLEYSELTKLVEWDPLGIISIAAMCNGDIDHNLLGKIALNICKIVNGLVSFGYHLNQYTQDTIILNLNGIYEFNDETLFDIPSFKLWLEHPDFNMVK